MEHLSGMNVPVDEHEECLAQRSWSCARGSRQDLDLHSIDSDGSFGIVWKAEWALPGYVHHYKLSSKALFHNIQLKRWKVGYLAQYLLLKETT